MGQSFTRGITIVSFSLMLTGFLPQSAIALNVDIYNDHSATGGGAPFSDLEGSFTISDVLFATNFGYDWHPFVLSAFGAFITGLLNIPTDGNYIFTLNSDDGSLLFISSILAVDNGGAHRPTIAAHSVFLLAGSHPFKVEFFEDFGGSSSLDLYLPDNVTYVVSAIPESGTVTLLGIGLLGFGLRYCRARR